MVFSWHFLHGWIGFPAPLTYTPALFPFSILTQGHTGVSLFMTLSGYLFAKLLDGKRVSYPAFFWNRFLRLFPLLTLVVLVIGVQIYLAGGDLPTYFKLIAMGYYAPTLPNGGWSITVEMHFYVLLPLILFLARKSKLTLPAIVLAAIALRVWLHHERGEVQTLAYLTLVGHIDQFVLGILAFIYRRFIAYRHVLVGLAITAFLLFFWWFNSLGGFNALPTYPSPSVIWIYLPTLEGIAYGLLISYYDNSYRPLNTGISRIVGLIGAYSYSIYLLHFFVVMKMSPLIDHYVMGLSNFYVACFWSLVCFTLMLPVGYLSFRFIEAPFLKFRRRYIIPGEVQFAGESPQ
jgi:peptidoglycan/LPS O-acetylase OafA/YrhL